MSRSGTESLKSNEFYLDKVVDVIDYWRKRDVLKGLDEHKRPEGLRIVFDPENHNFTKIKAKYDYFSGVYIAIVDRKNRLKYFRTFSYFCEGASYKEIFKIYRKYGFLKSYMR
ncbi:MAG: hypothetical protein CSA15_11820 [Candidatus Delongbacteria bacterium]|nr:MAG: hypothetical protein CSA15_11820 [Candidatus Delongbacteria bacterium]